MSKIVAFIGLIGSGKTTESNKLIEIGYEKVSFADKLREYAYFTLGYKPKDYHTAKAKLIYLDKLPQFISDILKKLIPNWLTLREYLQKTGDVHKIENRLFWTLKGINRIEQIINSGKSVVIDDCRTKHEIVALQAFSAKNNIDLEIIFCDYRSKKYNDKDFHGSEALSRYLRDELGFKHLHKLSIDKGFYYKKDGCKYKVPIEIYSNEFLADTDLLTPDKMNDFENIVTNYKLE